VCACAEKKTNSNDSSSKENCHPLAVKNYCLNKLFVMPGGRSRTHSTYGSRILKNPISYAYKRKILGCYIVSLLILESMAAPYKPKLDRVIHDISWEL